MVYMYKGKYDILIFLTSTTIETWTLNVFVLLPHTVIAHFNRPLISVVFRIEWFSFFLVYRLEHIQLRLVLTIAELLLVCIHNTLYSIGVIINTWEHKSNLHVISYGKMEARKKEYLGDESRQCRCVSVLVVVTSVLAVVLSMVSISVSISTLVKDVKKPDRTKFDWNSLGCQPCEGPSTDDPTVKDSCCQLDREYLGNLFDKVKVLQ